MKKKNLIISVIIIILLILIIPVPTFYKDGGTVEYNAILYGITKRHSLNIDENIQGYMTGTEVRILWFEVYNDVEFVSSEMDNVK